MLEPDFDTPSLRRLAGESPTTRADASELAGRTFKELGLAAPLRTSEAIRSLAQYLVRQVAGGTRRPEDGALHISRLLRWEPQGAFHDIVLLNYAYELELDENPVADLTELNRRVVETCTKMIESDVEEFE